MQFRLVCNFNFPSTTLSKTAREVVYTHMLFNFYFPGIFWDIENIRLPRCKSALAVVEAIRRKFLVDFWEAEFIVVCDVRKEKRELVSDLNNAQVL